MKNISTILFCILFPTIVLSQTTSPTPATSPESVNYSKLEIDFLAFLKEREFFNPKQHFNIKPNFNKGHYDATIKMTDAQAYRIATDDDSLDFVGKQLTGVLVIALMKFAKEHGLPVEQTPYCYAMGFLFVTGEGVTGKPTFAQFGYSSYDQYSDGVKYTSKMTSK